MKRVVLIIISVLILLAVPATVFLVMQRQELRQRAAPATTLTMTPSSVSKQVGDEFTLEVHMDTATNQVVAVQVSLTFDPTKLEVEWINNGTMFPNIITSGVVGNGTASIALGAANTVTPITGTGLVATLKVKALAATTSPVSVKFAEDTFVGALGEGSTNVLSSSAPATVTIGSGATLDTTQNTNASNSATPALTPTLAAGNDASQSASPSAITIDSPKKNQALKENQPTIEGTAPPGSTITIVINSSQQITATVTTDANGNWTYTVPETLDAGPHTVTVATENPTTGKTETATLAFVVSDGTLNGASGSAIPVTGSVEPTILLLVMGLALMMGGAVAPVFLRKKL